LQKWGGRIRPSAVGILTSENLKFYESDLGISGMVASDKPRFLAIGYFYITDLVEYNKAIAANTNALVNDFKNYTNVQPVIQISEVKQVK